MIVPCLITPSLSLLPSLLLLLLSLLLVFYVDDVFVSEAGGIVVADILRTPV